MSRSIRSGSSVYGCFLDASKAFDLVDHSILFHKLLERGLPLLVVRFTGKTGRDHGTRFGGKQCPLLRSARVSAGLRCIFITDSAQTVVRHLESVRSRAFPVIASYGVRVLPYGLRVFGCRLRFFSVRAACVCLRRPNGLPYLMV